MFSQFTLYVFLFFPPITSKQRKQLIIFTNSLWNMIFLLIRSLVLSNIFFYSRPKRSYNYNVVTFSLGISYLFTVVQVAIIDERGIAA